MIMDGLTTSRNYNKNVIQVCRQNVAETYQFSIVIS